MAMVYIIVYCGVTRLGRGNFQTRSQQLHQHQGEMASLRTRPLPGRPARLSVGQWQRVLAILTQGALHVGFEAAERWTLQRLRAVMVVACGVHDHAHDLARRLKALEWSPQQPAVYARERDAVLVRA
jgi:transposase